MIALKCLGVHTKAIEVLYGGARYGGKSVFLCLWVVLEAYRLIRTYRLSPQEHPIPVGFIGRKVGKTFRETTLQTFYRFVPSYLYRVVGKPAEIIIDDSVMIRTGGLDKSENIQQFLSAELCFYGIDQAEEITRDDIMALRGATFWRMTLDGRKVPGKGLLTANPAQCWLKSEFIDGKDKL